MIIFFFLSMTVCTSFLEKACATQYNKGNHDSATCWRIPICKQQN